METKRNTGAHTKKTSTDMSQKPTATQKPNKAVQLSDQQKTKPLTTLKRSNGSQTQTANDKTKMIKAVVNDKNRVNKAKQSKVTPPKQKKKTGMLRTIARTIMILFMVAFTVVVGVIGWWGFDLFFRFYFTEKSPVMGIGTEYSRIESTPEIKSATIKAAQDAILASGHPVSAIEITQVGPSIHFFVTVPEEADLQLARNVGPIVLTIFSDTAEVPNMFSTYEAQLIMTKVSVPKHGDDILLRPAGDEGAEQAFPQYGVSNKNTNTDGIHISWGQNGV